LKGIAKLMQRDVELKRLYNGEIKKKEVKMKKKISAQAFENYMQLYFDIHKFVTVNTKKKQFLFEHFVMKCKFKIKNPDYFELVATDLFPKPVLRGKIFLIYALLSIKIFQTLFKKNTKSLIIKKREHSFHQFPQQKLTSLTIICMMSTIRKLRNHA
jgi:hypothetical protein